ncbi:hypothetical protein [Photorhabdus khanii]|uniref:Uncharacterized protein n=2 Tax=Photorhabdus khanii TaxID=1004150 RepID=A0A4R4IWL6_9GAMM|nr:hypothetical protein [Photorhabdus khanii]ETS32028.1 hypothetical protein PTE_01785 [Photorhabdus khanii NC19]TDB45360.1 hypothetical protein C5467_22045 [Photorhabdus khanii subsp. guanajuatensis]
MTSAHPVEIVYSELTNIMDPALARMDFTFTDKLCSCCGRIPAEFNAMSVSGLNGYKIPFNHCRACQSFFVSDIAITGIENPQKPKTSQKFGMWSGVGAIIEPGIRTRFLAPPGVVAKLPMYFTDRIHVMTTTMNHHLSLLQTLDLVFPLLYI